MTQVQTFRVLLIGGLAAAAGAVVLVHASGPFPDDLASRHASPAHTGAGAPVATLADHDPGIGAGTQASAGSTECEQWDVTGTWRITQVNGYTPTFTLTQTGTTLAGTASLTAADVKRGNYTGSGGALKGSLVGDEFVVTAAWAPHEDGSVRPGTYVGRVSQGKLAGSGWTGSGPSRCVRAKGGKARELLTRVAAQRGLSPEQEATVWGCVSRELGNDSAKTPTSDGAIVAIIESCVSKLPPAERARAFLHNFAAQRGLNSQQESAMWPCVQRGLGSDADRFPTGESALLPVAEACYRELPNTDRARALLRSFATQRGLNSQQESALWPCVQRGLGREPDRFSAGEGALSQVVEGCYRELPNTERARAVLRNYAAKRGLTAQQESAIWTCVQRQLGTDPDRFPMGDAELLQAITVCSREPSP